MGDPAARASMSDPNPSGVVSPPHPVVVDQTKYGDVSLDFTPTNQFLLLLGINDDVVGNGKGNFAVSVHMLAGNVAFIPNVPNDPPWVPGARTWWTKILGLREAPWRWRLKAPTVSSRVKRVDGE